MTTHLQGQLPWQQGQVVLPFRPAPVLPLLPLTLGNAMFKPHPGPPHLPVIIHPGAQHRTHDVSVQHTAQLLAGQGTLLGSGGGVPVMKGLRMKGAGLVRVKLVRSGGGGAGGRREEESENSRNS